MYGPLCWQGYEKDPGGFKKTMWFRDSERIDCKVSSTWSVCGKGRAEAFTHRHLSQDKKEEISQLDYIIGPMRRNDEIYIHIAGRLWATWDHYPIFARIQEEAHARVFQTRNKKWTGWKPTTEDQSLKFKKEVMRKKGSMEEDFATIQNNVEIAAKKVVHRTKAQREKEIMSIPENVRLREEAAARCTTKIQRRVLEARGVRAEHLVKCSLEPVMKKAKNQPLTDLYVKDHFTEDREEWQKALQRHCEEANTDLEEIKDVQEKRIEYFWKKGNQQFTEDGRNAEITVDLVLQARTRLSDNKVNGPEDAIVSEMITRLSMEKIHTIARCFQERFLGLMESPNSWKVVKLVFFKKPDAAPTKGIRSYRAIALTSVMSEWYACCVL